jgi:hypothetical protein
MCKSYWCYLTIVDSPFLLCSRPSFRTTIMCRQNILVLFDNEIIKIDSLTFLAVAMIIILCLLLRSN